MAYRVVLFIRDNAIECVPVSWIEEPRQGELICYWPLHGINKKLKRAEMPDKELWKAFQVRLIGKSEYPDYQTARKHAKRAENTSNIDSDDAEPRSRKRIKQYDFNLSGNKSDESNVDARHKSCVPVPVAPTFLPGSSVPAPKSSTPKPGNSQLQESPEQIIPREQHSILIADHCNSVPAPKTSTPKQGYSQQEESAEQIREHHSILHADHWEPEMDPDLEISRVTPRSQTEISPIHYPSGKNKKTVTNKRPHSQVIVNETWRQHTSTKTWKSGSLPVLGTHSQAQCQKEPTMADIMSRLDDLQHTVHELKSIFIESRTECDIDSILPQRLHSLDDMRELETKMEDQLFRKKMVKCLATLQGGEDLGPIVRVIMRAVMTNALMSKFSGNGQKGKLPFFKTVVYKVIMKAVRLATKFTAKQDKIQDEIMEVLKNAPNQPGGINYQKKKQLKQNKTRVPEQQEVSDEEFEDIF